MHDFQATVLHQLGLDHEKLIFKHLGRRFRLTDVSGRIVNDILAWQGEESGSIWNNLKSSPIKIRQRKVGDLIFNYRDAQQCENKSNQ